MKLQNNIPKSPGIYRIYYKSKSYIGASFNVKNRLQKHFSYLNKNNHSNKHMQRVFNKDSNFKVEILKLFKKTNVEELLDYETYYHIKYDSVSNGFNIDLPRRIQSKFKLTEDQISKAIKKSSKCIIAFDRFTGEILKEFQSISEAARYFEGSTSNISGVCRGKLNHIYGCTFCYEKDYNPQKDYSFPNDHKKGKKHTKEHIEKLQKNHSRAIKVYKYDSNWNLINEYYSRADCERQNGFRKEGLRYKTNKETLLEGYYYTTIIKDIV